MISGIQHVSLDVDDLAAARAFYVDVLGLTPIDRPRALGEDSGAWLCAPGGVQVHLVVVAEHRAPTTGQHLAFEVHSVAEAAAAVRASGREATDPFDVGAGRQVFARDPAGNLIEFNEPTGGSGGS